MKLHKENGLARLFYASILLAVLMPLFIYFAIKPKYEAQIIHGVEKEALVLAYHLAKGLTDQSGQFSSEKVKKWAKSDGITIVDDFNLLKVKAFGADGEVYYSTSADDIGKINEHDYFRDIVAKGQKFTKVIVKNHKTLEGQTFSRDVVETYVPIMYQGQFSGAFELYYDITDASKQLNQIFYSSLLTLFAIIIFFIGVLRFLLNKLEVQMQKEKKSAILLSEQQVKLQEVNDRLEEKQMVLINEQGKQNYLFSQIESAKREWENTMDCVGEMVLLTDMSLRIKRCNKSVVDFSRLSYGDLMGKKWTDIFHDNNLTKSSFRGNAYEYFHEPTGKWLYFRLYTVKNSEDKLAGFVITLSDFSELKEISSALEIKNVEIAKNSEKLQKALSKISVLIENVVTEKSFGVFYENEGLTNCWEVMACHQEGCVCYGKKSQRCWLNVGTYCNGEIQGKFAQKYKSCSQCKHFLEVTSDPIYMIGEQFNNMMHILKEKNEEVEQAYHQLKKTQGQLLQHEKMASIGQLAAGVAHEINNPVGFISSNLGSLTKYTTRLSDFIKFQEEVLHKIQNEEVFELLQKERQKIKLDFIMEDIGDLLIESIDGCERVKKIVDDLKSFSQVDQAERQLININDCLDATLNIAQNEIKNKVAIDKQYGELDDLDCLPQQLNQVFMNLLVNAAHAIEEEGSITIRTWQANDCIYTTISDNGQGIAPENLEHIFEPFFTTKDVGTGTGLGLSIVYDIIEKNHGGKITADSKVGVGTTFTIQLPLAAKQ